MAKLHIVKKFYYTEEEPDELIVETVGAFTNEKAAIECRDFLKTRDTKVKLFKDTSSWDYEIETIEVEEEFHKPEESYIYAELEIDRVRKSITRRWHYYCDRRYNCTNDHQKPANKYGEKTDIIFIKKNEYETADEFIKRIDSILWQHYGNDFEINYR